MTHSMTGYGTATAEFSDKKIKIEIKSLNSKQFDLFTRIPHIYKEKEIVLRNELSQILQRGKIDLTISIDYLTKDVTSKLDYNVIEQYHRELSALTKKMNIEPPQDWLPVLLRLPDVAKPDTEELNETEWNEIHKAFCTAVNELIAFRAQEGKMIQQQLQEKTDNIQHLLTDIAVYENERIEKIKSKISDNLASLENVEYDKNRFEQEMIYYIEKLDINEEKTRLLNHLNYFREILKNEKNQGKKLGFVLQEIGREINTLGSKSNHSAMQQIVVRMKDELEQMKEQSLNVL